MSAWQVGWFYYMTGRGGDLSIPLAFGLAEFGAGWLAAEEYVAEVNGWM